jgi:hypothetical protein
MKGLLGALAVTIMVKISALCTRSQSSLCIRVILCRNTNKIKYLGLINTQKNHFLV